MAGCRDAANIPTLFILPPLALCCPGNCQRGLFCITPQDAMMKEMLAVWEDGPDDPIQRFVLLTIADSGMDPKTISLSMLSERTAIAESLLADLLRDLRDDQWVSFPHGIHTDEPFECNLNLNQ